jgi:hypothetical protein
LDSKLSMLACLLLPLLLSLPSSASPADSCRHQQTARAGNQQCVKWQASTKCPAAGFAGDQRLTLLDVW